MPRNDAGPHDDDPGPIETGPVRKGTGGAQYTSGSIQGSNISVGNASSINTQKIESDQLRNEALDLLDDLLNALSVHESEIPAVEAATAAYRELASPRPKVRRVRQLLNFIAVNVESNVARNGRWLRVRSVNNGTDNGRTEPEGLSRRLRHNSNNHFQCACYASVCSDCRPGHYFQVQRAGNFQASAVAYSSYVCLFSRTRCRR